MATATQSEALLTAEEFAQRPDPGFPEELVRGRIVRMPPPGFRHGQICNRCGRLLGNFAEEHDLGHVVCNDSGVITERGPDTVRGADVAFYSYQRLPKEPRPVGYPEVPPDVVVEVRSPNDRWQKTLIKVAEYIGVGVGVVVVLDDERRMAQVFHADQPVRTLTEEEELILPEWLPGFRVRVAQFFE